MFPAVCYTCKKQMKRTGQRMKFWAYFLIPVYTVLFTRGYNWFTTNFSVIGNFFDRKKSFLLWGVLVGGYFYVIHRKIRSRVVLHPICAGLIPAALVLLFCAITTPYLPEELPFKSVLHIVFAFLSTVLVLLYLLWIIGDRYRIYPGIYRRFLYGWGAIVGVSALLLAVAGIISSALEIYVTLTSVAMAERLACRVGPQMERANSGGEASQGDSPEKSRGKHPDHLLT